MTHQVAIIGAGPAGIACALQLKRHGITPLLLERDTVGGLLRNAHLVENYPGFPWGISGPRLVKLFAEQLRIAGLTVKRENILHLEYRKKQFHLRTDSGWITADLVVLAPGTKPRQMDDFIIPPETEDRVYYEIYPILGSPGRTIAIIGAGDAALDYALNLALDNKVIILNRGEHVSGLQLLFDRCMQLENITYYEKVHVYGVAQLKDKISLLYKPEKAGLPGSARIPPVIHAEILVIAVGREPNLDLIGGTLTEKYQTLIDDGKLHLIGDVKNGRYRQTAISVGDGIRAAMRIAARAGATG